MKKPRHKRFAFYLFTFIFLTLALFHSGCGIVSVMGTSTRYERKIAAEYDLTSHTDQKILVLVNQPAYLNAQVNLRFYLTEAINRTFVGNIKFAPEQLVSYSKLSEFRSNENDFSLLLPAKVGEALDANMVLLVMVEDYQLHKMPEADYYKGSLSSRVVLLDTATGKKLWPESAKSKSIKVGFEIEQRGQEVAVKRLAAGCAHCIVRYLYDCPKNKFKIADDKSDVAWKSWNK